jgi:hypothetical protein
MTPFIKNPLLQQRELFGDRYPATGLKRYNILGVLVHKLLFRKTEQERVNTVEPHAQFPGLGYKLITHENM